jgi:hypothetical protein
MRLNASWAFFVYLVLFVVRFFTTKHTKSTESHAA